MIEAAGRVALAGWPVSVDAVFDRAESRAEIERVAREAGAPFFGFWLDAALETRLARVRRGATTPRTRRARCCWRKCGPNRARSAGGASTRPAVWRRSWRRSRRSSQGLAEKNSRRAHRKILDPAMANETAPLVKDGGALFESVEINSNAAALPRRLLRPRQQATAKPPAAPLGIDVKMPNVQPAPMRNAIEPGDARATRVARDNRQRPLGALAKPRGDLKAQLCGENPAPRSRRDRM